MKNYFIINENKEQSGPINEEVLIELYKAGQFHEQSHAWCEGMDGWQKLSQIMSELGVELPMSTPPPFVTDVPSTNPEPPVFVAPPASMPPCPPPISPSAPVQESNTAEIDFEQQLASGSVPADSPISLYLVMPFKNMFNYKARSTRKEWWIFSAFCWGVMIAVSIATAQLGEDMQDKASMIMGLSALILGYAWLALSIRRMHDLSWPIMWWGSLSLISWCIAGYQFYEMMNQQILFDGNTTLAYLTFAITMILYIPFAVPASLLLIVAGFIDSKKEVNKFGPSPKYFNN